MAATENDLKLAHLLLDVAADMSLVDRSGKQAFHVALERGRVNIARLMLMAETCDGADEDANCTGINKEAGLLSAAKLGHEDIVRLLLEMQANMDGVDENGMTALHQTCAQGRHCDNLCWFFANECASTRTTRSWKVMGKVLWPTAGSSN